MAPMQTAATSDPATTTAVARAVAWLAGAMAVGSALMAVAHAGVDIPLLSGLGPGGAGAVPPAVVAFTVSALLFAAVAYGAFRGRAWAWAAGLVLSALTVLGAAMPYRGVVSLAGIVLGLVIIALLLSRPGRSALLPSAG